MSNSFAFAWRSLVRQPARSSLGILGVAAVGALLFDMLLLSQGLLVSMADLFDRAGFDLRVTATDALPGQGPRMADAVNTAAALAELPGVRAAIAIRFADATVERGGEDVPASIQGVTAGGVRPWTMLRGRDLQQRGDALVNDHLAQSLRLAPGSRVSISASCISGPDSPPPVAFVVAGVADFPFDTPGEATIATGLDALNEACGGTAQGDADLIMVASKSEVGSKAAEAQITARAPALRVLTNEELVSRFERTGFTYFRQISTVLTTVTIGFAALLIAVLLTVSVNQRLGEIAAIRALGFSRRRVISDVLWESALIVGTGGLLSLPLGVLLASGLDNILKTMPGIPTDMHFFVFRPDAVGIHAALLAATALLAALYPVQIVARLPIAATLRNEVVG
jgi:putative ABC transport system permease protein